MSKFIVAVTGHRPDKLGGYKDNPVQRSVKSAIQARIGRYQYQHPDLEIVTGMALGVDQWVAEACIKLKVPFHAYQPFKGQESKWPESSQNYFYELLSHAKAVKIVCDGGYAAWKMQKRNEAMIDDANILMAVWDGSPGGTGNCVAYAIKKGVDIDRLVW